jgi:hypothetical protein
MLGLVLFLFIGADVARLEAAPFSSLRDKDVLYLDETLPEAVTVPLSQAVDVYSGRDLRGLIATLPTGMKVRVIGYHPDGWVISCQFRGNKIEGWIGPDRITIGPEIIQSAKEAKARLMAVSEAIEARRVIEGMTFDDVKKSLGKPEKTSFRRDAAAKIDTWIYTVYERVPQYGHSYDPYGRMVQTVTYVKVPVGETVIEFHNGSVVAVQGHRSNLSSR